MIQHRVNRETLTHFGFKNTNPPHGVRFVRGNVNIQYFCNDNFHFYPPGILPDGTLSSFENSIRFYTIEKLESLLHKHYQEKL